MFQRPLPPTCGAPPLSDADCIYVGGGNSFFLLQELRRTGADALLAERIADGIPQIGESAGSVIMSPDIGYCSIMDRTDRAPGLRDYKGLGLTDFHVVPHLGNPTMGQAARLIVRTVFHGARPTRAH